MYIYIYIYIYIYQSGCLSGGHDGGGGEDIHEAGQQDAALEREPRRLLPQLPGPRRRRLGNSIVCKPGQMCTT